MFDATEVEWAIATRVQGDRDVIIIPGARFKPLDPSLPPRPPGVGPTGAKVGIDATISEDIPKERYERISYAYAESAKIADYLAGKSDSGGVAPAEAAAALADRIYAAIEQTPMYYSEIAEKFSDYDFQNVARAFGRLHVEQKL